MRKITLLISLLLAVLLISPAAASQNNKVITKSSDVIKFAFLADLHISDVASNIEDLRLSVADINAAAAAGSEGGNGAAGAESGTTVNADGSPNQDGSSASESSSAVSQSVLEAGCEVEAFPVWVAVTTASTSLEAAALHPRPGAGPTGREAVGEPLAPAGATAGTSVNSSAAGGHS